MSIQKVNRRLGNRKTTTGCITCKIRRVKCDEGFPSCRRCVSTGRKCDGYKHLQSAQDPACMAHDVVAARADCILGATDLDAQEFHTLHFFIDRAASGITVWANDNFWARIVPQLSQSQQAVRHAAIALGSLVRSSREESARAGTPASDPNADTSAQAFALKQYGKAIKATLSAIDEGQASSQLATVTCILFVCIEVLQGHQAAAIKLFYHGQTALVESKTRPVQEITASVDTDISMVFDRLAHQIMMFNINPSDRVAMQETALSSPIPVLPQTFTSLTEARSELLNLLCFTQALAVIGGDLRYNLRQSEDEFRFIILTERQKTVNSVTEQWYCLFQHLTQRMASEAKWSTQERIGISMLRQQYHIMQVWLAGNFAPSECSYDEWDYHFEAIVAEATSLAKLNHEHRRDQTFSLEMGLIPCLYWTALKCRNPTLRRQAVSLLVDGPKQEGLWDSRVTAKVASRVIQLEENLDNYKYNTVCAGDIHNSNNEAMQLPPEAKRVKNVRIHLKKTVAGQEGNLVEFHTIPDPSTGVWHVRREFLALHSDKFSDDSSLAHPLSCGWTCVHTV